MIKKNLIDFQSMTIKNPHIIIGGYAGSREDDDDTGGNGAVRPTGSKGSSGSSGSSSL